MLFRAVIFLGVFLNLSLLAKTDPSDITCSVSQGSKPNVEVIKVKTDGKTTWGRSGNKGVTTVRFSMDNSTEIAKLEVASVAVQTKLLPGGMIKAGYEEARAPQVSATCQRPGKLPKSPAQKLSCTSAAVLWAEPLSAEHVKIVSFKKGGSVEKGFSFDFQPELDEGKFTSFLRDPNQEAEDHEMFIAEANVVADQKVAVRVSSPPYGYSTGDDSDEEGTVAALDLQCRAN